MVAELWRLGKRSLVRAIAKFVELHALQPSLLPHCRFFCNTESLGKKSQSERSTKDWLESRQRRYWSIDFEPRALAIVAYGIAMEKPWIFPGNKRQAGADHGWPDAFDTTKTGRRRAKTLSFWPLGQLFFSVIPKKVCSFRPTLAIRSVKIKCLRNRTHSLKKRLFRLGPRTTRRSFACPGTGKQNRWRDFQPRSTSRWTIFFFHFCCGSRKWPLDVHKPSSLTWTCHAEGHVEGSSSGLSTQSKTSGASRRHCSSNLKLRVYLRIHYSMHAQARPPNLVLGGASGGPACGRKLLCTQLCQPKKALSFLSTVLYFGFGKK